ncbi:hypothetical protein LPJ68_005558, partial [Coemansia sp. RSA 1086]
MKGIVALMLGISMANGGLVERIIGGTSAQEHEYPFAVRLTISAGNEDLLCGGTLIQNDMVVTAAHCMVDTNYNNVYEPNQVAICYGSSSIAKQSCSTARNITVHPSYNPVTLTNDIALVQLSALTLTSSLNTIPIYSGKLPEGTKLTTMGWGKTQSNSSSLPSTLMSVEIEVGSAGDCKQALPSYRSSDGPEVCSVNALTPGKDSCQGDSGSPSIINVDGKPYLAALTSSGVDLANPGAADCATKDGLAFYTHAYYFMDFITKVTGASASALTSDSSKDSADEPSSAAARPHRSLALLALAAISTSLGSRWPADCGGLDNARGCRVFSLTMLPLTLRWCAAACDDDAAAESPGREGREGGDAAEGDGVLERKPRLMRPTSPEDVRRCVPCSDGAECSKDDEELGASAAGGTKR